MKNIKYSVIGTSWITKAFISGAALTDTLTLDAVCSRTAERGEEFRAETGAARVFTSVEALALSDTDCVYVASPNVMHFSQCKTLLENGKHVICEKPLVTSPKEYYTLRETAEKNSLVYLEAIMYMHTPARDTLIEALSSIGEIRSVNFDYSQLSSKYPALKRGETPNIFNPLLKTGALMDLGVYCVYPAVDLFGEPQELLCRHLPLRTGADGAGSCIYTYADKLITITYSKVGQSRGVSQIIGDSGTITVDSISQLTGVNLFDNSGNKTLLTGEKTKAELMGCEARDFYDFITDAQKNKARYELCLSTAEKAALTMERMRQSVIRAY